LLPFFSKAKKMTFSSKSSFPPDVPRNSFEQYQHRHPLYSTPPQLTLIDVLMMQTQAQAPSGEGIATMPIWTGGDAVSAPSEERGALTLAAMLALLDGDLLDGDTTPSGRNGNAVDDRGSADHPKHITPQNSPSEPSAQ
jgi:hypothetical protein